jgi:DNA-binding transcriptional ArsR family regulator
MARELPEGFPEWLDPERDLILTPKRLKSLSHPLRVRLLEMLQQDGPATATSLAARIGRSSGVTSYHLRVLAEDGFIEEDTKRGNARDRYWRARHRLMSFTLRSPDDPGSEDNAEAAGQWLRVVAGDLHQRMLDGIDIITSSPEDMATMPWGLDDWPLRLTHDEARELRRGIWELANRYRRQPGDPDPRPGTTRAYFQLQILPDEPQADSPREPS